MEKKEANTHTKIFFLQIVDFFGIKYNQNLVIYA